MLVVHFRRPAEIIVATDDVDRHECNASKLPAKVLYELCVLRGIRLALNVQRPLTKALPFRKEHGADLCQALQGVKRGRLQEMAVGPVVVARREDKRMAHALEGI